MFRFLPNAYIKSLGSYPRRSASGRRAEAPNEGKFMSLLGCCLEMWGSRSKGPNQRAENFANLAVRIAMPFALLTACTGTVRDSVSAEEANGGDSGSADGGSGGGTSTLPPVDVDPKTNPPPPPPVDECKGQPRVGPAPLRRLTNEEYANTLRDLLGLANTKDLISGFPLEGQGHGFDNNAETSTIPRLRTQKMFDASEKVISMFDPTQNLACAAAGLNEACVKQFVESFGTRAMRRPPSPEETTSLVGLYNNLGGGYTARERLGAIVEALLMSAQFNFLPEFGDARIEKAPVGTVGVSSYEMATRLSYFLWNSMPDEALFSAAASNSLTDNAEVSRQVKRMLASPKAKESIGNFARQWTDADKLNAGSKDAAIFPDWNVALATDLRADIEGFFSHAMLESKDGWSKLMTSTKGFVTPASAKLYNVAAPNKGVAPAAVDLPEVRGGLLTRPGFLAAQAQARLPSPILRGLFIRRELLCQALGSPPAGAAMKPDAVLPPGATNRQIKTAHSAEPRCAGCHALIDPPGFALESFDAIGRYSLTEKVANGTTVNVDTRGKLEGTDVDGDFANSGELTNMLARSAQAQSCVVAQWFRYSRGRLNVASDECSLADLSQTFNASGGDFVALFSAIATHDSFRFKPLTVK